MIVLIILVVGAILFTMAITGVFTYPKNDVVQQKWGIPYSKDRHKIIAKIRKEGEERRKLERD
jgi:hypothetical protein